MTEREQKLQRTVEWLLNLLEDAVNKTDDYCKEKRARPRRQLPRRTFLAGMGLRRRISVLGTRLSRLHETASGMVCGES